MRTLSTIQTLVLTLIVMATIPASSFGVDGQRKLTQPVPPATFPIVINQAGSYVLTSNLAVTDPNLNAIAITVNDVTLDLNGHKIQGPHTGSPWGGDGNGIYAQNRYGITIKNGKIWGFGDSGISLYSDSLDPSAYRAGHCIDRIQALNNGGYGIRIFSGLVTNCIANANGVVGIRGFDSTITGCTANSNVSAGIATNECTINNCTANYNTQNGIDAYSNSTVIQCTAYNNNSDGISAVTSLIINCTANSNLRDGIYLAGDNRIEGNNLRSNGRYGLAIGVGRNYAIKNTASRNQSGNYYIDPLVGSNYYMPTTGDNANHEFPFP